MHLAQFLDFLDHIASVVSGACAVLTFFGASALMWWIKPARSLTTRLRTRRSLSPTVLELLAAQRLAADQSAYEPWHIVQPLVSDIYVEQQAETSEPDDGPARTAVFNMGDVIGQFHDIVLLGGAGTGKSTLAKHLVRESAQLWLGSEQHGRQKSPRCRTVALRVSAEGLAQASGNAMADTLAAYLSTATTTIPAQTFRRQAARHVDWLIVIDGADEVQSPAARGRLLALIRHELAAENRVLRLIITSRSPLEVAVSGPGRATELRLCVFDPGRLSEFATKWFTARPTPDAAGEARRYLQRVSAGPLAGLVRVPLMAAMAAVIHEFDVTMQLPTSRTELYAQFVEVIRRSRSPVPATERDVPATISTWLNSYLEKLITLLARQTIDTGPGGLLAVAAQICAKAAPESVRSYLNTAVGRLVILDYLRASSLFAGSDTSLAFIHYSVAEYLAASQAGGDENTHVALLANPDRRSYALFCLARTGRGSSVISDLMGDHPPDALRAGHLLLDGTAVDKEIRQRVVDELGNVIAAEGETAGEALTILTGLAVTDRAVVEQLFEWSMSPQVPAWARVLLADSAADIDPPRGERLLITLASDRTSTLGRPCRRWAAHRLVSRGNPMGPHVLAGIDEWADMTPTAGHAEGDATRGALTAFAYRQVAVDTRQSLAVRVESALMLAESSHDPAVLEVLRSTCLDHSAPTDLRRRAAGVICQHTAAGALSILRDRTAPADTVAVAVERLCANGDSEAYDAIRALLRDGDVRDVTKYAILDQKHSRGSLTFSSELLLDSTAEPSMREYAARLLSNSGGTHQTMRALCVDKSMPSHSRVRAVSWLTSCACPEDLERLRRVAIDVSEDHQLRYYASAGLVDRRDETGFQALRDLSRQKHNDTLLKTKIHSTMARWSAPRKPVTSPLFDVVGPPGPDRDHEHHEELPSDPAQLRRLVLESGTDPRLSRRAAGLLLWQADGATLDWFLDLVRSGQGDGWLTDMIVREMLSRSDPDALNRCRAIVNDDQEERELRARLAGHLIRHGNPADLATLGPLAAESWIDNRLRELIVNGLFVRGAVGDIEILVQVARAHHSPALTKGILEQLIATGQHVAVRRLWPMLWDYRYDGRVRRTLAETLAYSGAPADLDELRRLIANPSIESRLRQRVAEILSHRGDPVGRAVLRMLTCDNAVEEEIRQSALATIAVPREGDDLYAIRHLARDGGAPTTLREAAMRALAGVGTPSELDVIREIGFEPANRPEVRQHAGVILAQLGDEAGLAILAHLGPPTARQPKVLSAAFFRPGRRTT